MKPTILLSLLATGCATTGLNDDLAYAVLRRGSMQARQSLEAYCATLATGDASATPDPFAEPQEALPYAATRP